MQTPKNVRDSSSFMLPAESTPVKEGPLVEKITLEEIDVSEERDAKIEDKERYFENHETFKVPLPEGEGENKLTHRLGSCNKLSVATNKRFIHAAGP